MIYRLLFTTDGNKTEQAEFFKKALEGVKKLTVVVHKNANPYTVDAVLNTAYPRPLTETDAIITFSRDELHCAVFHFSSHYDESNVKVLADYAAKGVRKICNKTNAALPISFEVVKVIHHGLLE